MRPLKQLIQITNHNRPTVDEIMSNFFNANEQYQSVRTSKAKKGGAESNVVPRASDSRVGRTMTLATNLHVTKPNPFKACTV